MKRSLSQFSPIIVPFLAALLTALSTLGVFSTEALAQNPVPFVNQPLVPDATPPGGPDFTLTVNGTGFVFGSLVHWNGSALATQFVSGSRLTATVPASDIATASTASVTVVSPAPGGGTSNVAFFTATAATAALAFTSSTFATSEGPAGIVAGDFNGDGKLDLAVASSAGTVSILLGNGDGTFQSHVDYTTSANSTAMVTGDFNNDGKLDLVVGNSILLGNGDGTFQPSLTVPISPIQTEAQPSPSSLLAADFNGDGNLDLAAITSSSTGMIEISVALGNGDGTFGTPVSSATPIQQYTYMTLSMSTGDFNGDGKLDLAVTVAGACIFGLSACGASYIQLGNGDGTFQAGVPTSSAVFFNPTWVGTGDFNGDSKLDLISTDCFSRDTLLVSYDLLLGAGDSTFTPAAGGSPPPGSTACPASGVIGDFNGDGRLDLAAVNGPPGPDDESISILLGNGDGSLQSPVEFATGAFLLVSTVGDFNGDGRLDLAIAPSWGVKAVTVLLQQPTEPIPFALSAVSLQFGNTNVGSTSAAETTTVTNTGSTPVTFTSISASGDFAETNDCGASLAAGASCVVSVTFTPKVSGIRTGAVTISYNGLGSPQAVNLTGTGVVPAPNVTLSPASLTFGNQPLGTTSPTQSVTLSNCGTAALSMTSIAASGDFAETNTCGNSVAAGTGCTISVTFTPTAAGVRGGAITITDDAAGSPQMVSLTGNGQTSEPVVTLSLTSLVFPNQVLHTTSAAETVTLKNPGSAALTVTSIAISGDYAQTNSCGGSVAAGGTCTISVTFTPTAPGTRTGTVTISDNAPGSPQVVSLTGTGMGPVVSFSATTMSVGGQVVGTAGAAQTVTLTNSGNATLSITGLTILPASFTETNTCGSSLAAGASCTITVTFTPSAAGEITGMLSITDNASGSPQQVTLSGVGQDFGIGPYNLTTTIPAGWTAAYDLAVWPAGGFNQTVSLACSGVPQQSSCTVTPTSTTLDGRNHAVITLRVLTSAPASVPTPAGRPLSQPPGWLLAATGSILGFLIMLALEARRRRTPRLRLRLRTPAGALLLLVLLWVGCGGGSSFVVPPTPTGGTPSGTYVVTVTATSGHLSRAVTMQLTVK